MRFTRFLGHCLVSLFGAALLSFGLLFPGWSFLPFVGLVPWALLFGRPGSRAGFFVAWVGGAAYVLATCHPLLKWGPLAGLILILESVISYAIPLCVLRASGRYLPSVPLAIRLAITWTAAEWLWNRLMFYRLPIFVISHPLAEWPLMIQIADIVGAISLVIPICLINGLIAELLLKAWRRRRAATDPWTGASTRSLAITAATAAAMLLVMLGYGIARIDRSEPIPGPRIALVQPALPHVVGSPYGVHLEQIEMTVRKVPKSSVDLIIWPENAILDFYDRPHRYLDDMRWLAKSRDADILFGAMGRSERSPYRTTNEAVLLERDGTLRGRYAKIDIIPWAEYFPFEAFLSRTAPGLNLFHLRVLLATRGFFPTGTAGSEEYVFPYRWEGRDLPFTVAICSESAVTYRVRNGVKLGAQFLVNIISEGQVGGLVQLDMLRLSQFRAVEHRMPFIRVGNTGISAIIDESGRVLEVLKGDITGAPINEPGVLISNIPLPRTQRRALYTSLGDVIPTACVIATGLAIIVFFVLRIRRGGLPAVAARAATATFARTISPLVLLALTMLIPALAATGCGSNEAAGPAPDYEAAVERGKAAFKEGRHGIALKAFNQAILAEPEHSKPFKYVAEIYRVRKQAFRGYRFFDEHRDAAKSNADVAAYLGFFELQIHRKDEARETLLGAVEMDPTNRLAMTWLSTLLLDANEPDILLPLLRRYLGIRETDLHMQRMLAETLLALGEPGEAAEILDRHLELSRADWEGLRLRGIASLEQGQIDEAISFFDESLQQNGTHKNIETRYHLARIALRQGDLEAAGRQIDTLQELEREARKR